MSVSLKYYTGSEIYTLDPIVTSIVSSGDVSTSSRSIQVSLKNTLNGEKKAVNITPGKDVRLFKDKKEIFRGVVFETEVSSDGAFSFTSLDYNHYLTKNTDTQKFVNMTATQIIKQICKKYDIPTGKIADTGYAIPKLILRDKTLYDMIIIALTETRKKTSKVFLLSNDEGKLTLTENKKQVKRLAIEDGSNLISANYTESIQDLRNSVRLTGKSGEDAEGVTVSDNDSIKKYGLMREKQDESDKTDAELKPIASALLKELNKVTKESNVVALGDVSITAGKMVQVSEKMTGISGGFYVITDTHTFEPNKDIHTMALKVSKTLDITEIEYEAPAEEVAGKFGSIIYETGWKATAYAPSLGGINGSGTGLTASSTKVVEGRTIAVDPTVIPLGSVVAVYVASAEEYSGIYLAEDTGGAIKGKKIDIAVVASKAKAFGIKPVQVAILERGSGREDARNKAKKWDTIETAYTKKLKEEAESNEASTGQRKNVVDIAKSFKGKLTYSFGGKNIDKGSGDCSGYTYYVFNKIGVNIGHGTSVQSTKGTQIATKDAQPGDLIFFKGTYRAGVSHVGIVTKSGSFIGLGNSGCKEDSYTSGYWKTHFMEIRRVLE